MLNIVSGNFEILKQQIAELKKEINELRYSIEHTENVLEVSSMRGREFRAHWKSIQLDPSFIEDKLIDLEDQSSWNNLRVDGTKERPNQTWEDCKSELHTLLMKT